MARGNMFKPVVVRSNRRVNAITAKDRQQDKRITKLTKLVNTRELRYQDVNNSAYLPTWNGVIVNLIAPSQGDTDITRTGDKINIEKVEVRFNASMINAGANQLRMIVFRDKGNAIAGTVSNVLDGTLLGTANACQTPYEEDFRKNIEVFYDKTFLIDSISKYQIQGKFVKTFKTPKPMQLVNNTTTVSTGQFKFLMLCDLAIPNIGIDYASRVWYSDL